MGYGVSPQVENNRRFQITIFLENGFCNLEYFTAQTISLIIFLDLDISSEIRRKCSVKKTPESFSLIEFGCAPGGIATFIFDINWRIDSYAKDGGPEAA